MSILILNAQLRTITGKKVKSLRKQGLIPAVVYGHKTKPRNLSLESLDFQKVYQKVGGGMIKLVVDLIRNNSKGSSQKESIEISNKVDKERSVNVLIQAIQTDPLTDKIIHVDFHQVKETEKVIAEIELKFVGESKAVKELNGVLVRNLDKIKVEALPKDLIHEIEVDISKLATFGNVIRISDFKIPLGIKVLEKLNEVVATVQPPQAEEVKVEEKPEEKIKEIERVGENKKKEAEGKGEEKSSPY